MKKLLPKDPEAVEIIRGAQRANEVDNLIQRKKKKEKTKFSSGAQRANDDSTSPHLHFARFWLAIKKEKNCFFEIKYKKSRISLSVAVVLSKLSIQKKK
jgi:hypothetical protein